jgi:hypothetical protein
MSGAVSMPQPDSLSPGERAGVSGCTLSIVCNHSPGTLARADLSHWER